MEREFQEEARAIVIYEMTNAVLAYLHECGHEPAELGEMGKSLSDLLEEWWDEGNVFRDPKQGLNGGDDKWRVFWKPVRIPDPADDDREAHS
jgi:hypothetical protein